MPREDLLRYLTDEIHQPFVRQLAAWLTASPRFYTFVENYRDKIRKKLRTAQDREHLLDLGTELAVAHWLIQDRRCEVAYELLGVGRQRAPDLTVTFKTHTPFHVEVTRLRNPAAETTQEAPAAAYKVANTLCDKLGQLQPSLINLLALVAVEAEYQLTDVQLAWRFLQERAAQKDDLFFQRRSLDGVRHFQRQQLRLSGILLCQTSADFAHFTAQLWVNPQAKHALPADLKNTLAALSTKTNSVLR